MILRSVTVLVLSLLVYPGYQGKIHAGPPARQADVVVYGGTPSGIIAAIAVVREGKSVVLIEPSKHLGGMVSGGLGATDTGNRGAIGGYSKEFFNRVREYYIKQYGPMSQQVKDCSDGFRFEPSVAMHVFKEMLAEAKITVQFDKRLAAVKKDGAKIVSITMEDGDEFQGKVFIDASYEGDLLAKA
jgi:flavin-dependent dehydrogenase